MDHIDLYDDFSVIAAGDGMQAVAGSDGRVAAGPFQTNAEAWRWIDRHGEEGREDSERANRVRVAFSIR